jgi:hypothetical protein
MMMKSFNKTLSALLLGTVLVTTACSPEQVQPVGNREGTTIGSPQATMQELPPSCSDSIRARLQDATGGYAVNYCVPRPGAPCPTIAPEWGQVSVVNDQDYLNVRVSMAFSWFISSGAIGFGGSQPLTIDPVTGRPIVTNDWITFSAQLQNSYLFRIHKSEIPKDANGCFDFALRVNVERRGFNVLPDPQSQRELFMSTNGLSGTTFVVDADGNLINSSALDPSPYITANENIMNFCWQYKCPAQVPGGNYMTNQCPAAPATPTYICNANGAGVVNVGTVRCLDVDGSLGTINFTGPGTLVVPAGRTVTCALNAFSGCTLIVEGTLNWAMTASYNNNMYIYVAPGGVINRAGTSSSLTTNGTGSVLVNAGTIDIDANLITRGALYNSGTLTTRNMTLTGGSALLSNRGTVIVEQNLTVNCGTPSTCSASALSTIQNCGRLDVNTSVNTAAGSAVKNYCSLVSRGSFTQAGTLTNQGLVVAGLSGGGNGYVNNGSTIFENGSVIVSRFFNWGTNRTIQLNGGNAWIISANTTLSGNTAVGQPFFQSIGGTGRLVIPAGSALTGSGELYLVDADPFGSGDAPLSATAISQTLNPNAFTLLTTRGIRPQESSIVTCVY